MYQKWTTSQSKKLSNGNFWPKPKRKKSVHRKTVYFRTLTQHAHVIFALLFWERRWRLKKDHNLDVYRRLGQVEKSNYLLRQSWTKSMKQWQEIKQNRTGWVILTFLFVQFLTENTKVFFPEGRLGIRFCLHSFLSFFHNLQIFLDSRS